MKLLLFTMSIKGKFITYHFEKRKKKGGSLSYLISAIKAKLGRSTKKCWDKREDQHLQ